MLQIDNRKENLVNKGAYKIRDFKEDIKQFYLLVLKLRLHALHQIKF